MKRSPIALLAMGVGVLLLQRARADIVLQDFAVNVNATSSDYNNVADADPTALPGMNASGFSTATTGDMLGTGLGTLIYTFSPGAAGSYFVNFYFDESGGIPFYNEYGIKNGAAPAGMSWEIAQVNPSVGGIQFFNGTSQSFPNALDDTNHVPAGNTNYLNNCTVTPCNADVATALGFAFSLTSNQEAIMTLDSATTNPGGFYLEQVHPVDPANATETDIFLSGSINIQTMGPPPVPEPGFLPVLAIAAAAIAGFKLRKVLPARGKGTS